MKNDEGEYVSESHCQKGNNLESRRVKICVVCVKVYSPILVPKINKARF